MEMDSSILWCTEPVHMTPTQYADNLYAKSFKLTDVYYDAKLNNISIERVDNSICHSLRNYWATHLCADVNDSAFKAQSPPMVQKSSGS